MFLQIRNSFASGRTKIVVSVALMLAVLCGASYVAVKSIRAQQRRAQAAEVASLVAREMQGLLRPAASLSVASSTQNDSVEGSINKLLPDVKFSDLAGQSGSLRGYRGKAVVVAMTSVGCPISKKLMPALARLSEEFRDQAKFLLVNAEKGASPNELKEQAAALPNWRYVRDNGSRLTRALDARTTTEVFVIDQAGTLRYRGAVDDRFDVGINRDSALHDYLHDALIATLNGAPVRPSLTAAPGCRLARSKSEIAPTPITWHNQISRFVQYNCAECHRPGESGPFALETYAQVVDKQAMIEYVLDEHIMPPWFADPAHGAWRNSRAISNADREMFRQWVENGAVEGDPADASAPLQWARGWSIDTPDIVIDVEPQQVPAEGTVPWRKFAVHYEVPEDLWISAAEIRPGVPDVVHHAMLFVEFPEDDPRRSIQTKAESESSEGGRGFWLSYFPGRKSLVLPPGRGKLIPRNGKIFIQIHYTPNGTATVDETKIGFKLLASPPETVVVTSAVKRDDFRIPPNSRAEYLQADTLNEDIRLLALMPHMHYRGAAAQVFVKYPDGRFETLLHVPRYDFDWQVSYEFEDPLFLARGSQIVIRHEYDNTAANPHNPDVTQEVIDGPETTDEMMINFIDWEPAGATLPRTENRRRPFR